MKRAECVTQQRLFERITNFFISRNETSMPILMGFFVERSADLELFVASMLRKV